MERDAILIVKVRDDIATDEVFSAIEQQAQAVDGWVFLVCSEEHQTRDFEFEAYRDGEELPIEFIELLTNK